MKMTMTEPMTKTAAEVLTAKVAAMTPSQRSERIQEIVYAPGKMDFPTNVEFAKLLGGPNVQVFHYDGDDAS
jgi:hypothetical protein